MAEARGPVSLEIDEIVFDGEGALALLRLDGRPQARYFRLVEGTWRRAPLTSSVWGGERATIPLPDGHRLTHYSSGPEALAAVVSQLGWADTWEELFQRTLGRSTTTLERDVAASLRPPAGLGPPSATQR